MKTHKASPCGAKANLQTVHGFSTRVAYLRKLELGVIGVLHEADIRGDSDCEALLMSDFTVT